jgi:myo-inositol-1(or 4)-monophosphatase
MGRYDPLINVMKSAAEKALRRLQRDFGEVENLQLSRKGPADFVTIADQRTESLLRDELLHARPNYGFIGEESEPEYRDINWIVDPIDGTTNFIHGIPHFCISIGVEENGQIIAGLVLDPIKQETFWATKGGGAFCNNRRLRVSQRSILTECLIATGTPFAGHGKVESFLQTLNKIMGKVAGIRRFGSAALDLCYVASGRFDGYFEDNLKPWDIAAGILIASEAGGMVTDYNGKNTMLDSGHVIAANTSVHQFLMESIG